MFKKNVPILLLTLGALSVPVSCSHDHGQAGAAPEHAEKKPTNRLDVPPEVVANLGITFVQATWGKVGSWISVPGELYVPETHRWNLRAPARGRLTTVSPRWKKVEAGEVIAELLSPGLRHAQQDLLAAQSRRAIVKIEGDAAAARLVEGEAHLGAARKLESASLQRLDGLRKLNKNANAFGARELLSALRDHTDAGRAALEAAVQRDKLRETAREKDLLRSQAQLKIDESLAALSILSGRSMEELLETRDGAPAWKAIESIVVRAPAGGTVVEVFASGGETVDENLPLALILDSSELRFRGWLPEGDLRLLRNEAPMRVDLPGGIAPITTTLLGPRPVADSTTRRVQVEAKVANPDRKLPQGLSATAQILVKESAGDEVLIPEDCVAADGLEMVVFRRDPKNPNVVIRTPVELGLRGAGKIEILSGVGEGDLVVQKGIYQLKQTGLGKPPKGGHFHPDGTWHPKH